MISKPGSRIAKGSFCFHGRVIIGFLLAALFLFPSSAISSWAEIDQILKEAYGAEVARECNDYYSALTIPDDQVAAIRDAVSRLVEAGYPSGCPVEYLRVVSVLSRAGIHLDDMTNKIREGIAKKVSPERLFRVLEQRAEALLEARVAVLELETKGVDFIDKQMAYSVMADYLLRGIRKEPIMEKIAQGDLGSYPALENLVK